MKKFLSCFFILCSFQSTAHQTQGICSHWMAIFKPFCHRLQQVWTEGETEGYFTGYAWHNRYTYSPEKIRTYNETAWGGGIGKGLFDEKGNWHGLYAITFLDSHRNVEPAAGYAYMWVNTLHNQLKGGVGYSILVTARPDINNNIPFPGLLPWASLFYKKITIGATYIPGSSTNGNVLFILGKYTF